MEMAIEKTRNIHVSDEALERLSEAFKKATGARPVLKDIVKTAILEKAEYYEKRSLVAKNR
ncbi:hypothetical protein LEP1GSC079_0226 [Leptospira interrogans str. FPW1039]|uniref:Uncharacterized protein n=3 Tax=Leptospira TaxID=171 RepID=A0A9Q8RQ59_9LEPT|nr:MULTISPECIES: hypothetical protein [Leptospira]EMF44585.1 hypothetical protein LEP1GSC067_3645 [Leptospira interrogans serovar Lora str. TE 1992]EMJ35848.1 hypothetical protein LEP1GSC079_0226 [Leptospira interrogans str. FPW1039]EMN82988.1 hypothetical protein LEP1GSC106_1309 [Leptospira interrogans serovar Grippotyphosa str. UI 12764]TQE65315.1 hypothetical protein FF021_19355 [Leptospira noguchii]UOG54589.1 hypothetical protein MAL09_20330 [Leptospira noguchii]